MAVWSVLSSGYLFSYISPFPFLRHHDFSFNVILWGAAAVVVLIGPSLSKEWGWCWNGILTSTCNSQSSSGFESSDSTWILTPDRLYASYSEYLAEGPLPLNVTQKKKKGSGLGADLLCDLGQVTWALWILVSSLIETSWLLSSFLCWTI